MYVYIMHNTITHVCTCIYSTLLGVKFMYDLMVDFWSENNHDVINKK